MRMSKDNSMDDNYISIDEAWCCECKGNKVSERRITKWTIMEILLFIKPKMV